MNEAQTSGQDWEAVKKRQEGGKTVVDDKELGARFLTHRAWGRNRGCAEGVFCKKGGGEKQKSGECIWFGGE